MRSYPNFVKDTAVVDLNPRQFSKKNNFLLIRNLTFCGFYNFTDENYLLLKVMLKKSLVSFLSNDFYYTIQSMASKFISFFQGPFLVTLLLLTCYC
jgi:hypothetical protein